MSENEQQANHVIRLKIDSRLEDVFLVGLAVRGICSHAQPNASDPSQMEICVVEAVTNAIKHSYHLKPGHDIDIVMTLSSEKIEFLVCNTGEPMKPAQSAMIDFDPDDNRKLPKGGLGLYLIHRLMDEVTYESCDGVNSVRMCRWWEMRTRSR